MSDREENEMVQKAIHEEYTLDEEASQRIINARPVIVPESNIPSDINLSRSERIAQAKKILESRS